VVPVRIESISPERLPPDLRKLQMLPSEGIFEGARDIRKLVETLNTDYAWLKESTRLADRARQWAAKGMPPALLVGGAALADAETWATNRPLRAEPSKEILDYFLASRKRAGQRQRWVIGGALTIAAVAGSLAVTAFLQREAAIEQRDVSLVNQSRLLANSAFQAIGSGDAATGLLLTLSGLPDDEEGKGRPDVPEAENMLLSAILNLHERAIFDKENIATFSADRSLIAYSKSENEIKVDQVVTGKSIALLTHPVSVEGADFSPDASRLVTESSDHTLRIWDTHSGQLLIALNDTSGFSSASFSHDGLRLLLNGKQTADARGVTVWDTAKLQRDLLLANSENVSIAAFSPDGNWIVTAGDRVQLFDAKTGHPHITIETKAAGLGFSQGGKQLITLLRMERASEIRFWRISDGAQERAMRLDLDRNDNIDISRDGKRVVTNNGSENKLWTIEEPRDAPRKLLTLKGEIKSLTAGVAYGETSANFDPSGQNIATTHRDDTARIWELFPWL
jgi:WD40 repeat protein